MPMGPAVRASKLNGLRAALLFGVSLASLIPLSANSNETKEQLYADIRSAEYELPRHPEISAKSARALDQALRSKKFDALISELQSAKSGNDLAYLMLGEFAYASEYYWAAHRYFSKSHELATSDSDFAYCGRNEIAGKRPRGICKKYKTIEGSRERIRLLEPVQVEIVGNFPDTVVEFEPVSSDHSLIDSGSPPVDQSFRLGHGGPTRVPISRGLYTAKARFSEQESIQVVDLRHAHPGSVVTATVTIPAAEVHLSVLERALKEASSGRQLLADVDARPAELSRAERHWQRGVELVDQFSSDTKNAKSESSLSLADQAAESLKQLKEHGEKLWVALITDKGQSILDYAELRQSLADQETSKWLDQQSLMQPVIWFKNDGSVRYNNDLRLCEARDGEVGYDDCTSEDTPAYVIGTAVRPNRSSRNVISTRKGKSQYLSHVQPMYNPKYDEARAVMEAAYLRFVNAQNNYHQNQQSCNLGVQASCWTALGLGFSLGNLRQEYELASSRLAKTPQMLNEPVYVDYEFSIVEFSIDRITPVDVAIIDGRSSASAKSRVDILSRKTFTVHSGLHPNDRYDRKSPDSEDDVKRFLDGVPQISLAALTEEAIKDQDYAAYHSSPSEWPTFINRALNELDDAKIRETSAIASVERVRLIDDARTKTVVVVEDGTGLSRGSGFFIRNHLVITNHHVIEDIGAVFVRNSEGKVVAATVVAVDPVRDLAALRVPLDGKPALLDDTEEVRIGAVVEAIGNPGGGAAFSLTRGTISQVQRTAPPLGEFQWAKVLYLQTDAAINKGNSGGPLFLGDRVVGVNTWGIKKNIAEGISYAVHASEVRDFLDSQGLLD